MNTEIRIGNGIDIHAFAEGRKLIIGGIEIPFEKGLLGHSDADVLLHAISDALLGALALGDIGKYFPDTDSNYKNADSSKLLLEVYNMITRKGYKLVNLDSVITMQRPKLMPYLSAIRENIAKILCCDVSQISVKATTTEKLGFVGREEGVAAYASVIIKSI